MEAVLEVCWAFNIRIKVSNESKFTRDLFYHNRRNDIQTFEEFENQRSSGFKNQLEIILLESGFQISDWLKTSISYFLLCPLGGE